MALKPKGSRVNARKQARLQKAANTTTEQRASKKQISTAAINTVKSLVDVLKPFELSPTQRFKTYALMLMDDAVWASFDARATAIERAQANGKLKYNKASEQSKAAKDYLQYCMNNMQGQTPRSVGRCAAEMVKNGSSPMEIVFQKGEDEYSDYWTLKKLAYIDPITLDQAKMFNTTDNGDEIVSLRQSINSFRGTSGKIQTNVKTGLVSVVEIDYRRVAMAAYMATSSTPFGTSPLDAAYTPWREKQLLQEYLLIGVTRDFAGTPVLRLPSEVLEAAENDPNSPEAKQVLTLTRGMQTMHSGDATYLILPSDTQSEAGTGVRDYDIDFKGVDGGKVLATLSK
ncbi:hypothetical protein VPHG_00140 [Vibrio phage 11895-B1]|uniref:hypothetical protein n=1 Tax=Vibrio phage 11895-B1 TaxID=754075 RepID=UPI0002C0E978|nr:hypothetical protein VPHG_00140 [Vibrio phage 11895-B1]AGH32205.1 hypothetical protein VPHG_00140 [Vibrio phage 11895-B1]